MNLNMIELKRLTSTATMPIRSTTHSAAHDLFADIKGRYGVQMYNKYNEFYLRQAQRSSVVLEPLCRLIIPTGFAMACHPSMCVKIYPRSGLSANKGITMNNCVAIIDADYRGEVHVILENTTCTDVFTIEHGMRIAQMMLEKVEPIEFKLVDELQPIETNRKGGFGSTGI